MDQSVKKIDICVYLTKSPAICEGENKNSLHPKVYLNITSENETICPYCSQKFKLDIKW